MPDDFSNYVHIQMARLLEAAESDRLIFTEYEFAHLKVCKPCFKLWKDFIHALVRSDSN